MSVQFLKRSGKPDLAYSYSEGHKDNKEPLVMFCGGYRSDMNGSKATFLEEQCRKRGQAFVRFDYSGHGQSGGDFNDGTIGAWIDDAIAMFDHINKNGREVIVIGSSMGGWIGLSLCLARQHLIKGFIGIAAAPDFTVEFEENLSAQEKQDLKEKGFFLQHHEYNDDPYRFTRIFFDEARSHCLLNEKHTVPFPIYLLQGEADTVVFPHVQNAIKAAFTAPSCEIQLIPDGDHSLSREQDLKILNDVVISMSE